MSRATLTELEAVTTVARRGGFRAAARELGVSSSSLSHAIAALEERIGARLFNRTTRSVALTAAGEQFIAEIAPALAAIEGAIAHIGEHSGQPSGTLRLNMALGAARMLLEPLLLEYLKRHPAMALEIVTEGALVDVIGQGFDAGFRLAEAVPPDMIAVPVEPTTRMIVVGAPSYFASHPVPRVPHDLLQHTCVRSRLASGRVYHWEFERHGETLAIDVSGPLVLDEGGLMKQAAIAGAGLTFLPEPMVRDALTDGRLVQALDDWTPPYPGLCLYYPGRRHVPAKLRALIELIREIGVGDGG
jgi:DNA-binding transcriptional LysR family regulator